MDKNIQEALKWIYASLGGDISDLAAVDDITVILNAIAKLDTVQKIKSATELPSVTDDDDGDVLTVVEGAWAKAAPGGGSDLPADPSTDGTYTLQNTVSSGSGTLAWGAGNIIVVHDNETLDKTWQEIHDYLAAGKVVISVFDELGAGETGEVIQYVFTRANFEQDVYKLFAISVAQGSPDIAEYDAANADDYPAFV